MQPVWRPIYNTEGLFEEIGELTKVCKKKKKLYFDHFTSCSVDVVYHL